MMRVIAPIAFVVLMVGASSTFASRPVKKIVTACVVGGELTSGPYTYRVRRDVGSAEVDLKPYEGKRMRVRGYLLPGDILIANAIEVVANDCPAPR